MEVGEAGDAGLRCRAVLFAQAQDPAVAVAVVFRQVGEAVAAKGGHAPDLSTRRQRRAATRVLTVQLERIRDEEERYLNNIPNNLQGSCIFDRAEQCVSLLNEAIELLESAY